MNTLPARFVPFAARPTLGLALLLLPIGCTVGPDYTPPAPDAAAGFHQPLEGGLSPAPADLSRWWASLKDPVLDGLITRAVGGSLDLREAQARLREARAQRGIVAADGLPQIDASGNYTRQRFSQSGTASRVGGTDGDLDNSFDLYQAGFDASWEIDVFGRVRRGVEAADADIGAAEESRRDVLVSLLSEVARNYVELRSLQSRLAIARKNVDVQQASVEIAGARAQAGLASELDTKRAQSQLASTRSQIPRLQESIAATINRLSVLLGERPGSLAGTLDAAAPVPPLPPEVPVGLPSDMLRRRPDIRAAERRLAAATARVGVAIADLYPRFSLTGSFGLSSDQFGTWGDADSRFWSFGPAVRWPVFEGGRLRSAIGVQNAREEQALIAYERSVLTSFEEVENAIVAYSKEQTRHNDLAAAVAAEREAVALATEAYTRGLTDFSAVIDAQRQLYILEDQLAQSDGSRTTNLIGLYKALGGGWEQAFPEPTAASDPGVQPTPTPAPALTAG